MEYIKDSDPKRLAAFFRGRMAELKQHSETARIDLLPVLIAPAGGITESPVLKDCAWEKAGRNYALEPDGRCWWLRREVCVPAAGEGEFWALDFSFGSVTEGLLYVNGRIYSSFPASRGREPGMVRLGNSFSGGRAELLVHLFSGEHWGAFAKFPLQLFERFDLVKINGTNLDFYDAFSTAFEAAGMMSPDSPHYHKIINALEAAYGTLDFSGIQSYASSAREALSILEKDVYNGENLQPVNVGVFGHAHIDLAWLWTLDVTAGKSIRTFAGQIELLNTYSGWKFQQSQAPLYEFVKEKAPGLYEEIKKKVKAGQWCPEGAAWVEFDANITGGESIIRQIMYGKKFFREEFGIENTVAWLPDVFGFSASLPQIFVKSGIKLFATSKISWNKNTRFPYDTFWWKGIDGTEILAHFITAPGGGNTHTYNTQLEARQVYGTWKEYLQKGSNADLVMPFGYGDGGGGPKDFMVRRLKWLKKGIRGFIGVREESLEQFSGKLLSRAASGFPVWDGELYLEHHRGCLTTQAFCKKENRRLEFLLERTEILSLLSAEPGKFAGRITKMWKLLLLNQFHDILPGSSVKEVYAETRAHYAEIERECKSIIGESLRPFLDEDGGFVTLFNPLSAVYDGYARLPGDGRIPPEGECDIGAGGACCRIEGLKPFGFRSLPVGGIRAEKPPAPVEAGEIHVMENSFCRLKVDTRSGAVISLVMLPGGREFCGGDGKMNLLEIYEDKPISSRMGAWDLEYVHGFKKYGCRPEMLRRARCSSGKFCRKLEMKYRLSKSVIQQEIVMFQNDPLVYFNTKVDWREDEAVLKARFPTGINARSAVYDIQFGNIERPAHRNTLADHARFEVPAHKWADLSEGCGGLGVITDSKYGYSVYESCIGITLLRSPGSPDDTADRGMHEFTYALYPHKGSWREAELPGHAQRLNHPPMIFEGKLKEARLPDLREGLAEIHDATGDGFDRGGSVIIETIKPAEDGKGAVVRMYECKNNRGVLKLAMKIPAGGVKRAFKCSLLEKEEEEMKLEENGNIRVPYGPYEIITLKVFGRQNS